MTPTARLIAAAADGDENAWGQLTQDYTGLLWAIARSHRLPAADAADVVQTTWLRLVENLGRLRDPDRVAGWLATTARNECLRQLRRGARVVVTDEELEVGIASAAAEPSPEAAVVTSERERHLFDSVEQLPDRCRVLIRVLMADPPPDYETVSAALGMPVGSIGPTRARCLDRLRRALRSADVEL